MTMKLRVRNARIVALFILLHHSANLSNIMEPSMQHTKLRNRVEVYSLIKTAKLVTKIGAFITFRTKDKEQIVVKVAISYIDVDGARKKSSKGDA